MHLLLDVQPPPAALALVIELRKNLCTSPNLFHTLRRISTGYINYFEASLTSLILSYSIVSDACCWRDEGTWLGHIRCTLFCAECGNHQPV